ncbi:hypothetical protein MRX96_049653 [Rhipicephalus microplus]
MIDKRLSWKPTLADIHKSSRRIAGMASSIVAGGKGCSPDIALRLYNAIASAKALYAILFVTPRPVQRAVFDADHNGVVRRLFGFLRTSPIGPTLA